MQVMTLDVLMQILLRAAGEWEDIDLNGDIWDVPFKDLGYDSLALLETAGAIERDYGVTLSDDTVAEANTPRTLLSLVNEQLSSAA